MTPEEKEQPNTMAEEEKQVFPLNMIKRSWFHGWVALSVKGSLSCCKLRKLALAAENKNIELKNSEREMHGFHVLRLHKKICR